MAFDDKIEWFDFKVTVSVNKGHTMQCSSVDNFKSSTLAIYCSDSEADKDIYLCVSFSLVANIISKRLQVMERSGLRIKKNTNNGCKIAVQKKVFFSANLGLINH